MSVMWRMISKCPPLFDRLGGLALLALALPAILTICFLIKATSPAPLFVIVDLTDSRGTVVRWRRFRTTGTGTPPFHFIGRRLRQYSIDELPSLWSVVRGEMRLGELWRSFE